MHELSIVMAIARRVEQVARDEKLTHIEKIVIQIGELSSVVPGYIRACYPAAVDGTLLQCAELVIETIQGNARCLDCGHVYRFLVHRSGCPNCKSANREVLCGRELLIKEIVAY